ncbi:CRISPR-associated helicase Cas3' [uncultured Microbulbifer sp.]|uniref:CRISPR-associated helicase Cas3' n=1 Tax=uncultured Microbulbifer sp. TaxID=348147 RepID=UPI002614131A|nr:CRISPR-associated helicase Cas3' [uncultured Microbulbifer sp.]
MNRNFPNYFRYWGKAGKSSNAIDSCFHLLPFHSLDVAAVGWQILEPGGELCLRLSRSLRVEPNWLRSWFCFLLSLHDLGKFARSFQGMVPNLPSYLVSPENRADHRIRHDSLGYALWQKYLTGELSDLFDRQYQTKIRRWLVTVFGHHGQPPDKSITKAAINCFLEEDKQAATSFVRESYALFAPQIKPLINIESTDFKRLSWQLAGIAVLADWIGSDRQHFPYRSSPMALPEYWEEVALNKAQDSVEHSFLDKASVEPFASIRQQFNFIKQPTPLQKLAAEVPLGVDPQLLILEDVTGAGKTEVAMVLCHRLMSQGLANGIFVGLPTMATSNAMYRRMADSYKALYKKQTNPSLVLAHSARKLNQQFVESIMLSEQQRDIQHDREDGTASAYCNQWLADSRKKSLLAEVGVGTIDQALLGILPARHQSLRLLGLSCKVLLVDEVHAFDPYMRQLLAVLIRAHAAQGGSCILLSATLPQKFRKKLLCAFAEGSQAEGSVQLNRTEYPLFTLQDASGLREIPVNTREAVRRYVAVERLADEEQALELIASLSGEGHCVCWIRNSVKDAHRAYERLLRTEGIRSEKLDLFHSRYAMIDRREIETAVLEKYGKTSTGRHRQGRILLATQVVEQSLDLDFDVLISDLAPIDLLIQRAGRLQRHVRDTDGKPLDAGEEQRAQPRLYLLTPDARQVHSSDWLASCLPASQAVYPNVGELWRAALILQERGGFRMPEDARLLVESVYGAQAREIPEPLRQRSLTAEGEAKSQHSMGIFNALALECGYCRKSAANSGGWDEDVNIPTRLGRETVTVALVRVEGDQLLPYAQNEKDAWHLSQLSLPVEEWRKVEPLIPAKWQVEIQRMRRQIPALKWVALLPLIANIRSVYCPVKGWG